MEGNISQRKPASAGKSSRVDDEVSRLLSKATVDKNEFMKIRNKMNDTDLVDKIQAMYMSKFENVERRAKAFAQKILEAHGMTNKPFSQLLLKAHEYADKYELTDAEKTAFTRILQQELAGADRPDVPKITTNMSKVLGDITVDTKGFGMKVSDADYRELQDILKMRDEDKSLHSQVILQSLSYEDCGEVAVNGRFSPENGHNLSCHVHPVIAALFLMKEDTLEHHFLYSNMANIVASRYNQESFKTRPDYELFYNLVTDPNDIVCDSRSPLKDLKNRCQLQKQLWQSVLGLRNGQYYNCDQLDLMRAIDVCRLNKYDTPDLVYGRYDGTVLKRLFAAFSFRPTLVLSVPTPQVSSTNPYFHSPNPIVSTISTINLRLPQFSQQHLVSSLNTAGPLSAGNTTISTGPVDLLAAISQSQLFFENGSLIMKNTQVIDSRGTVTFFVDRRKHNLRLDQYTNPVEMVALPKAISGFERVNTAPINFQEEIILGDNISTSGKGKDKFTLRSVVCAKTSSIGTESSNSDLFIGSETYIKSCHNSSSELIFKYDPLGARSMNSGTTRTSKKIEPISVVAATSMVDINETVNDTHFNVLKTKGCLFVYQKVNKSK